MDDVFPNCQRILCSRHINENIKFKLESKVLKKWMESKTYDSFLEIRNSIVTNSNCVSSNIKVKGYALNHIQLILKFKLKEKIC